MTIRRIGGYLFFPLFFIPLFFYFQGFAKFHFFFMEQFQLFQYTFDYFRGYFSEIGGLSFYSANFLMQFYKLNFLGAIISSILITAITIISNKILEFVGKKEFSYLGILVITPFLVLHLLNYYYLAGTISFLLMVSGVLITLKTKHSFTFIISFLISLILFWISGPLTYQYLLVMTIIFTVKKQWRYLFYSLTVFALMCFVGLFVIRTGKVENLSFIVKMDAFYQPRLDPPFYIYLPFIFLIGSLLIIWLINFLDFTIKGFFSYTLSLLIICFACCLILKKELPGQLNNNFLKELDFYAQTGQWDTILDKGEGEKNNHLYMNYINLALLKKGELTENMFLYDQRNVMSLMVTWDKSQLVSNLISDIAFTTGQVSLSQNMSFEALVNYSGSVSGRCLQRLVETNIISGAYSVASKYLDILDKTLFYRNWSEEYRIKINAISEPDENGNFKNTVASISTVDNLMGFDSDLQELINCINSNPDNKSVIEFTEAYLMLSKDINNLKRFIETYYGTNTLPILSKSMQEAVIIYSENDPDYWVKYGVSNETINKFSSFKHLILENRGSASVATTLNKYFGDTFWYYYMFKS